MQFLVKGVLHSKKTAFSKYRNLDIFTEKLQIIKKISIAEQKIKQCVLKIYSMFPLIISILFIKVYAIPYNKI